LDRRLHDANQKLTLRFEGREVEARAGETVAVALFASGERVLSRSIKYHRPRGFFCLAGHCGACLTRIDGQPNVKACRALVREGMTIERQNAFPSAGLDVFAAADFFFARGMDHHTLMTGSRTLNAVMQKVVRQLAGLGKLPDEPTGDPAPLPAPEVKKVDVAIVGGGPAGLAAAEAIAAAGRKVLVLDEQDRMGGSYLAHPAFGVEAADRAVQAAQKAGAQLVSNASVLSYYPEDAPRKGEAPGLMAVHLSSPDRLLKLSASRWLYTTGAYDQNALFTDNDRPGVLSARAVGRLLVRFGILPGEKPVVLGGGPYAQSLAEALERAGAKVTQLDGASQQVLAAKGRSWVTSLEVREAGKKRRVACDLVAVAALPAPASEVPRQHGVQVELRPEGGGFACVVDERGASRTAGVFCAGDVTGFMGPQRAAEHGARVGAEMVE
jgi:sarcosine oxidase subunit alpha